MLNLITPGCKIVEVDNLTEGAACTALLAKDFINKNKETSNKSIPLLEVYNKSYIDGLSPSKWQTAIYMAIQSKKNSVPEVSITNNNNLETTELEQK